MNDNVHEMDVDAVRVYGDPVLRKRADDITDIGDDIRTLAERMIVTMREFDGIGLAGPQVGYSGRIVVIDPLFGEEPGHEIALINPVVDESEGMISIEEGCLSVPGIYEDVDRPERISFSYINLDGNPVEREAVEMLARVVQHEIDHLDGILFVDRLGTVKKQLLSKKLRTLADGGTLD